MKKFSNLFVFLLILIAFLGTSVFVGCTNPFMPDLPSKPQHTHEFAEKWTSDETSHWHATTCGHSEVDSKAEHSFGDWKVTEQPTEDTEGKKEKTCSVCEYTVTETIQKLLPSTGNGGIDINFN